MRSSDGCAGPDSGLGTDWHSPHLPRLGRVDHGPEPLEEVACQKVLSSPLRAPDVHRGAGAAVQCRVHPHPGAVGAAGVLQGQQLQRTTGGLGHALLHQGGAELACRWKGSASRRRRGVRREAAAGGGHVPAAEQRVPAEADDVPAVAPDDGGLRDGRGEDEGGKGKCGRGWEGRQAASPVRATVQSCLRTGDAPRRRNTC